MVEVVKRPRQNNTPCHVGSFLQLQISKWHQVKRRRKGAKTTSKCSTFLMICCSRRGEQKTRTTLIEKRPRPCTMKPSWQLHLCDEDRRFVFSGYLKISRSKAEKKKSPKRERASCLLLLERPRQKHSCVRLHFHLRDS